MNNNFFKKADEILEQLTPKVDPKTAMQELGKVISEGVADALDKREAQKAAESDPNKIRIDNLTKMYPSCEKKEVVKTPYEDWIGGKAK